MFKIVVALLALMAGLGLQPAQAQTPLPDRSGELALACLVRPEAALAYPEEVLKQRLSGFYRVQMRFTDANKRPEVEVLYEAGSTGLHEAVLDYVSRMRLPCLKPGQTVMALQEFSFDALGVGRVKSPPPLNVPSSQAASYTQCLRSSGQPLELSEPSRPSRSVNTIKDGNLIVEVYFNAPDRPPEVKVIYDSMYAANRDNILEYLSKYRLPCLPAGQRTGIEQQFSVHWGGNLKFAFNDLSLVKFLGLVKDLNARPVEFNLDTMGCPFRLRWTLGRPATANRVYEVGESNANRLPLLAWLRELELNLTKERFEGLLGAELLIDVPCGTIKLGDVPAKTS